MGEIIVGVLSGALGVFLCYVMEEAIWDIRRHRWLERSKPLWQKLEERREAKMARRLAWRGILWYITLVISGSWFVGSYLAAQEWANGGFTAHPPSQAAAHTPPQHEVR